MAKFSSLTGHSEPGPEPKQRRLREAVQAFLEVILDGRKKEPEVRVRHYQSPRSVLASLRGTNHESVYLARPDGSMDFAGTADRLRRGPNEHHTSVEVLHAPRRRTFVGKS